MIFTTIQKVSPALNTQSVKWGKEILFRIVGPRSKNDGGILEFKGDVIMEKIMQYMQKRNWNYKHSVCLFLIAFVICVISISGDPECLFRIPPGGEFSFFSKAFIRGCMYSLSMWIYVSILVHIVAWLAGLVFREIKRNINCVKTGQITVKKMRLAIAGFFIVIVLAVLMELLYGYFDAEATVGVFNRYRFLLFGSVAFSIYIVILYFCRLIPTFEQFFLILALTVGFCYSFGLMPNMISWDESIHYQRTAHASHLSRTGYTEAELEMMLMEVEPGYEISYIDEIDEQLSEKKTIKLEEDYTYHEHFKQKISYIPAGTILGLCKFLNLGFMFTFCMGRYTNFIFYAIIVYFAMKRLKSGKIILAVIAAFPLNVFLASVYSYDFFLTGLCMLGFSYLVGELQRPEEKITVKNAIIMIASLFIGIGTKAIYFPMLLLCLLLPASKFSSKKAYNLFRVTVIAATLITICSFLFPLLVNTASGGGGGGDVRGGENVSVGGQIQYILHHPFAYAKILLGYLFGEYMSLKHASGYTCHFAFLGFADYVIPVMMLLGIACFTDRNLVEEKVLNLRFRVVTLGLSFITIVLVATSMYLAFTNVGENFINGCQGRYLEPLIFPIVYCLGTEKIHFVGNIRLKNILFAVGSMSILYMSIWDMCISHYR